MLIDVSILAKSILATTNILSCKVELLELFDYQLLFLFLPAIVTADVLMGGSYNQSVLSSLTHNLFSVSALQQNALSVLPLECFESATAYM